MLLMASKKPKRGRPPGRQTTVVIQARVSPALGDALDQLAAQTRRSKNTEMVLALEEHLKKAGLWPPPAPTP
jgi:hypothetical protein